LAACASGGNAAQTTGSPAGQGSRDPQKNPPPIRAMRLPKPRRNGNGL